MLDKFVIEHAAKKKPKTLEMYDRCVGFLKPIVADAEELGMDAQTLAGHASRTTTEGYIRRRKAFIADPLPPLKRAKKRGEKA